MLIYCVRIYTNRIHKNMALWVKQVFVIFALLIPQLEATGISSELMLNFLIGLIDCLI